ncbi:MAG TPA: hypothetical protein VFB28_12005, partial [Terriglobales bacterium]|nr:hypothetical protein [Terriglobales bacterium]
ERSSGGIVSIGSNAVDQCARRRLKRGDPCMPGGRYQDDAFGRPGFHEEVGGDEEGKRECRYQRRTCDLVTNAHLDLFPDSLPADNSEMKAWFLLSGKSGNQHGRPTRHEPRGWFPTYGRSG